MSLSLPEELKAFVDRRIQDEGYGSSSESLRGRIRRDRDRLQSRQHWLAGIEARPAGPRGRADIDEPRRRAQKRS